MNRRFVLTCLLLLLILMSSRLLRAGQVLEGRSVVNTAGKDQDADQGASAADRLRLEAAARKLNEKGLEASERGDAYEAFKLLTEALSLRQKLFPKDRFPHGHLDLATSLNNLGVLLLEQGELAKAEPYYRQALTMIQDLYPQDRHPQGHPYLATSLNNLGFLLQSQGEYAQAEPYYHKSLAMRQSLYPHARYPQGHPDIAQSLNNLGLLLQAKGEYAGAERYYQQALAMRQEFYAKTRYPQGHPLLAISLSNIGGLYRVQGEYAKAEQYYRQTLAMRESLYPKAQYPQGHPQLATILNNLGAMHDDQGEYAKAEPYYRQALDMRQALYPEARYPLGHPDLAASLNNWAYSLRVRGENEKAEAPQTLAARMAQQLVIRYADLASEAESLGYLAKAGGTEMHLYLSLVRRRGHRAADYELVWSGRSVVTRIIERRHRDVLAAKDDSTRKVGSELTHLRQRLAHLLFTVEVKDADVHRREVDDLTAKKEKLEKQLALTLKLRPLPANVNQSTPAMLQKALAPGSAFVDMVRYFDFEPNITVPGRMGRKATERYLAYIVTRDEILRVDLKEASLLDKAWSAWREAIVGNRPGERETASRFADLVWAPLAKQLPSGIHTLFLAPAGILTQVPWAALPGSKPGSVLLEELAIATVPHGPYLLQRRSEPTGASERGAALIVGDVDYEAPPAKPASGDESQRGPPVGKVTWPALPGTRAEVKQLSNLAATAKLKTVSRWALEASTDLVLADLGEVRYAHLATHGFFADPKFRSAMQVDAKLFETLGQRSKAGGARSPLVLSGLVFAGANRQGEKAAPDRGILTAEAIVGRRLDGLELAVLSACETGLGELGGGEGVFGLARAFHIAGCKNVIASLWKVDDESTAALMGLFYRNLWIEKKSPLEALRQAQLHLYRHPEHIPTLARLRGSDFAESDLPKLKSLPPTGRTAPTSQWAAFGLSGLGAR